MDISGKVIIITGASMGIGRVAARKLAAAGAKLVLAARSLDKLTSLTAELSQQGAEALPLQTDMRDQAAVRRMVERAFQQFGRVDILINNAGQAAAGNVAEVDPDDYRRIIELNIFGPLYAIQAVVPKMRLQGGGLIVNISSMVSRMRIPGLAAYASTKSALNMLSDTARVELAADNIRVVSVYPRLTATDFGKNSLGNRAMRAGQRGPNPDAPAADSPDLVAEKILEAIQKEPHDQYMDS